MTPTEIADYLWHNTDEFNKHYGGTSGKGLVAATNRYGFVSTHLDSQSTIIAALQAGHHVLAAVQNNKFSPWGPQYSHEVVLRGYSNGNTYVYDPYEKANIGWYPVANLWNEQSRDAIYDDFILLKQSVDDLYDNDTLSDLKNDNRVLAHHIVQSFHQMTI